AARGLDLHQQLVSALVETLLLDQLPCVAVGRAELVAADGEGRAARGLEQRADGWVELAPAFLQPRAREPGQQRAPRDRQRLGRGVERGARVTGGEGLLGALDGGLRDLPVDP